MKSLRIRMDGGLKSVMLLSSDTQRQNMNNLLKSNILKFPLLVLNGSEGRLSNSPPIIFFMKQLNDLFNKLKIIKTMRK